MCILSFVALYLTHKVAFKKKHIVACRNIFFLKTTLIYLFFILIDSFNYSEYKNIKVRKLPEN